MNLVPMTLVRQLYEEENPGGFWFSKESMAFFKTQLPQSAYRVRDAFFFVTSEVSPSGEKRYSVRRYKAGDIDTVGPFHFHKTRAQATAAMRAAGKQEQAA